MSKLIILAVTLMLAAGAFVLGQRISDEMVILIVGIFTGVAFSIPVTVGLLIALTREPRDTENVAYVEPEIMVINPNVRGYLGEGANDGRV